MAVVPAAAVVMSANSINKVDANLEVRAILFPVRRPKSLKLACIQTLANSSILAPTGLKRTKTDSKPSEIKETLMAKGTATTKDHKAQHEDNSTTARTCEFLVHPYHDERPRSSIRGLC